MNFINYKYDLITIKVCDQDEFDKIQNLLYDYNFTWGYSDGIEEREIYDGGYNTIYVVFRSSNPSYGKSHTMLYATNFSAIYVNQFNYDKTIYTIFDCDKIKCIIKHGVIIPNYKPKRIERAI